MSLVIEDTPKFSRDAEDYVLTVITLVAGGESGMAIEAAALRVVEHLARVIEAMIEGTPPADMANALRRNRRPSPSA
jgi:hypothetical protein